MSEQPASPQAVAAAVAQAREALAKVRPPAPAQQPRTERQPVRELEPSEALQAVLRALRDAQRALAALEAALLDYAPHEPSTEPSTEEGTSHHD